MAMTAKQNITVKLKIKLGYLLFFVFYDMK